MLTESGQNGSKRGHIGKIQLQCETRQGELYFGLDILPISTPVAVYAHAK